MVPLVLTVAGSDSGGGAGIQADLRTFAGLGVYGATVVTAVTAQDSGRIHGVSVMPESIVVQQIDAVYGDLSPGAVKIGMLGSISNVRVVAQRLAHHRQMKIVLDPVLISTSGTPLLASAAADFLRQDLLPQSEVVTPNMAEAELMTGIRVTDLAGMEEAARALHGMGARNVLVKGGHLPGDRAIDLFYDGASIESFGRPRLPKRPHGTGCVLSAALAAYLAMGMPVGHAVAQATALTSRAIRDAFRLRQGEVLGPIGDLR